MEDDYRELRQVIYTNDEELKRFRQLVVNCVMATDVFDPKLRASRDERWYKAFTETQSVEESKSKDLASRKATIILEHLILASNVAHTMQHWHVYRKWNEKLFMETYNAFKAGRCDKDPAESWYQGEMVFFDAYVIPLAKKLKDCGVFGVFGDEALQYALQNRERWEEQGKGEVDAMVLSASKI
jgi:3'5'-cyclic nucleotide phosphodiesterase